MNRDEIIAELKISLSTFKRYCKAWDIPINKPEYSDEDLEKILHCKEAMDNKVGWNEYLQSIGKEPAQQTFSSGLVSRYSPEIERTAENISDGLLQALDMAVAEKFAKKLSKPSSIFSSFLSSVSAAPIVPALGSAEDLLYLEGEILEDEIPEAS